jgi:hypothetical protein
VKHFKQVDFIKSNTELSGSTGEVRYHLVDNIGRLDYFFQAIMLDGQMTMHYPQMLDTFTLLIHMREEFTKLVDRIASDSVTDQKLFTEVQEKAMPKVNLSSDLQDLNDLQHVILEQQEAATIMASLVESSPTLRPTESSKSAKVSPTQSNLAEASTLAESSKTTSDQATGTQQSMKKRRKSARQAQRCKQKGYVLPLNKPPLKKQRRNLVSIKEKKEEKAKAEKLNADALAYIGQAVCSAGREGCYHDGQQNICIKGKNKNGSECCTCNKIFHDVCLHVHDGEFFCMQCYKQNVMAQCNTETLFNDVFQVDFLSKGAPQPARLKKRKTSLLPLWIMFCDLKV